MDESDLTDENTSDTEQLQQNSDSVFSVDPNNPQIPPPFPGQPPSMDTTPPLRPKENPLISRPNGSFRTRSHSAVVASDNRGMGLQQLPGSSHGRQAVPLALQGRSQSAAFMGERKPSVGAAGGPLSSLVHKGRSSSGRDQTILCSQMEGV